MHPLFKKFMIIFIILFSTHLPLSAKYDAGVYMNFGRLFFGIFGTGINLDFLRQRMLNDKIGLSGKIYSKIKFSSFRFDVGAGPVFYPIEPMNGLYISPQVRFSYNEARTTANFLIYPELSVGWMWNMGTSFRFGIGVEVAVGWLFTLASNPMTFEPVISIWMGGPLF